MKILAVDTTTSSCSVAVLEGNVTLAELTLSGRETHSRHLLKNIDDVLMESGLDITDLEGFAVTTGPGSFTGLRIGLSTVKGLSAATGAPIAGVSSLMALASGAPLYDGQICAIIDARKNEVYASIYRHTGTGIKAITDEYVISPVDLAEKIHEKTLFVGTGVAIYRDTLVEAVGDNAFFCDEDYNRINAVNVGLLSLSDLGNSSSQAIDVVPDYIRKSDAEIGLEKKLSQ